MNPEPPTPPPPDRNRRIHVFISYRREDSSGQAGRLYDSLAEHFGAANVFMDLDTIEPGEDFVEVIDEALKKCDCVLVVIGPRWLLARREGQRRLDDPADYLRIEVEHSLARAPRVIPVLVQDAAMPRSADLPENIRGLARRNAFELSDSRWRLDVGRLIAALEDIEMSLGLRGGQSEAILAPSPAIPPPRPAITAQRPAIPAAPLRAQDGTALPAPKRRPVAAPAWMPPWMAQRIAPIAAVVVLIAVAALGAYVFARGSPTPSVPGGSGVALLTPGPGVTGGPSQAPTSGPSGGGASTEPRTAVPSAGATTQPTPVPVLPAGIGLGADKLELDETFTSPGTFPASSDNRGSFQYAAGGFEISVANTDYSLWTWHSLPARHTVLRVRSSVTVNSADARGGVMCGNAAGDFLYGVVGRNNQWAVGQIVGGSIQGIDNGSLPSAAQAAVGTALDVRLECAVTGGSSDRMQLIVNGTKVADSANAPRIGPFNRLGLLGSSAAVSPAVAHFDNLTTWSGETFREATETLRTHVPDVFASRCRASPEAGSLGQVAALICAPAGKIDQAEYYQFDTLAAMNAQFADSLRRYGSTATAKDCHKGPSTTRYRDTAGQDAGSLACYPNPGSMAGLLIIWSNESLRILSAGVSAHGTYDDLATWWANAGPLP